VAIATPYDAEFLPFLKRWVAAARRHNVNVWFRGNWSGWEQWFDYSKISRSQHIEKTRDFILQNPKLFEDGDVFSACPECENGGPGDPRVNGDVNGHRAFLIEEYGVTKKAFQDIRKKVASNYLSMNGDVAMRIMDSATTKALDGIVTIDHYVKTPEQLNADITDIAQRSGGKVILGEWGSPLPDIHGDQSEAEQKIWIATALKLLAQNESLLGLSYWVNVGGSTSLWDSKGKPRSAVEAVKEWYMPRLVYGFVRDELGNPVKGALVTSLHTQVLTDEQGYYRMPMSIREEGALTLIVPGYAKKLFHVSTKDTWVDITLVKEKRGLVYRAQQLLNVINPWRPAHAPTLR
jgi:hypothetical protein